MHLYEHQIATNASQQMIKVTEMVREAHRKKRCKRRDCCDLLTTYDSRIYDQ